MIYRCRPQRDRYRRASVKLKIIRWRVKQTAGNWTVPRGHEWDRNWTPSAPGDRLRGPRNPRPRRGPSCRSTGAGNFNISSKTGQNLMNCRLPIRSLPGRLVRRAVIKLEAGGDNSRPCLVHLSAGRVNNSIFPWRRLSEAGPRCWGMDGRKTKLFHGPTGTYIA